MILYHGTTESRARKILKTGLKPRKRLDEKGNWENTVLSDEHRVYLTAAYAPYFAFCACPENSKERLAILEIDTDKLDEKRFFPDEDFLEQVSRGENFPDWIKEEIGEDAGMKKRTEWFRDNIYFFQPFWKDSVENLGNASYQGIIKPGAIRRIILLDTKKNPLLFQFVLDPSISIIHYKLIGKRYNEMILWMFGKKITLEEFYGGEIFLHGLPEEAKAEAKKFLENRSAIEFLKGSEKS